MVACHCEANDVAAVFVSFPTYPSFATPLRPLGGQQAGRIDVQEQRLMPIMMVQLTVLLREHQMSSPQLVNVLLVQGIQRPCEVGLFRKA